MTPSMTSTKTNPKDSIKSTWRQGDRKDWTIHHWLIEILNAHPVSLDKEIPIHPKTDKVPHVGQANQHIWVLLHAFVPLAIHQAWLNLTGYNSLGAFAAFNLYFTAFNAVVVREVHILRRLGHKYGFLDGDGHERDGVPDVGVTKVATSLYKTTGSRIALATYLTYKSTQSPADALSNWTWWAWLVLEIGLYGVVLDFWFYWYHRAMHDVNFLWKFHRTHHLTKHPNALLSAYADHEQEFFDMVGVPTMTYLTLRAMGVPLDFYQWWICHQYIAYTEVWGHSGIRVMGTPPTTFAWLLKVLRCEIVIEDHDLHHRKGWRKSYNYGKQTRLWDRIFGTCGDRMEAVEENVDYVNTAHMPIL
jgi:sterol desaturase/sphingolipid hydroxylase (fatty acid hydroxylase superfamily)